MPAKHSLDINPETGEIERPDTPAAHPLDNLKMADLEPTDVDSAVIHADENGEFPSAEPDTPIVPETDADGNILLTSESGKVTVKLSFDNFYSMFEGAFAAPGGFDADYKPLAIQPGEEAGAQALAQITYEMIERYAAFLLIDVNSRIALYYMAGSFAWTKYKTLEAIQAEKQARRIAAKKGPVPEGGEGGEHPGGADRGGLDWMENTDTTVEN